MGAGAAPDDVVDVFLAGAAAVADALSAPDVAAAWDRPSVLEGQAVGGLAGHLARGGVWAVGDYLDGDPPSGPRHCDSAAAYFVTVLSAATEADHRAIRDRGASVGAVGPEELGRQLADRRAALVDRLGAVDPARPVAVVGGLVLRLSDYLVTRIVEQAVHLDDLARSIGRDPFAYPAAGGALAAEVAVEIARLVHGDAATLRALYRRGHAEGVLPVL